VLAWAESVPPAACFLSRVTLVELRFGIERMTVPEFRAELEAWLQDGVRTWFGTRILELDETVLLAWRRLVWEGQKANYTYAQPDALIAATALVHELGVVTRNTADFMRAGIRLLNPWTDAA
jgi:predicted nucleic acid-binding protein